MKTFQISIFALFILAGTVVSAQKFCTIANMNEQVLWVGIANPISLAVSDIPNDHLKLTLSDSLCKIEKVDNNNYLITPKTWGRMEISVMNEVGGKQEHIGKYIFRAKRVPAPEISIGTVEAGPIHKDIVAGNPIIYALRPAGFDQAAKYTLLSFRFTANNDKQHFSITKGRMLSKENLAVIKEMKPGESFTLSEIIVECPEGERKLEKEYIYTIK